MPDVYFQSPSSFPQTSANRTRNDVMSELAEYVGSNDSDEVRVRAGRAWDSAVREFNTIAWRFNRVTQSITLVAGTKTYSLSADFRSPMRGQLLDSDSRERLELVWVPYEIWLVRFGEQINGSSIPDYYTVMNAHNEGLVRFEPFPTGTLTYPTAKLTYFRRIALATGNEDRLNVPVEVDEAIFQLAAAKIVERTKGTSDEDLRRSALFIRQEVEREHRDYQEPTGWGANG